MSDTCRVCGKDAEECDDLTFCRRISEVMYDDEAEIERLKLSLEAALKEKVALEVQLMSVKAELEAWKGAAKAAEKFRADVTRGTALLCGESSDNARGVRDGVECILENGHEGFHQGKRGEMWS